MAATTPARGESDDSDRPTSWAAATWTVPLMPAVIVVLWLGLGGIAGSFASLQYTGLVVVGLLLVLVAVVAFRRGGARLRGISLGVFVGSTVTTLAAALVSLQAML